MKFEEAIDRLLNGEKIRRFKWRAGEYIERSYSYIVTHDGTEYVINCLDYEKDDWGIYIEQDMFSGVELE